MSRGSTDTNGFPCPMCGRRSHVTKSLVGSGTEAGTYKRYRKCEHGCRGFWTVERVRGTEPTPIAAATQRKRISASRLLADIRRLDPKRRGLLYLLARSWRIEDAGGVPEPKEPLL